MGTDILTGDSPDPHRNKNKDSSNQVRDSGTDVFEPVSMPSMRFPPPEAPVATEAYGRSQRIPVTYIFQGAQVRDVILLSEIEAPKGGMESAAVSAWLVQPSSLSDAKLVNFQERHHYLWKVIEQVTKEDSQLSVMSRSPINSTPFGFSHPEGLSAPATLVIRAKDHVVDLFTHIDRRLKEKLANSQDPVVITLRSESGEIHGQAADPGSVGETSQNVVALTPRSASQQLISFCLQRFCAESDTSMLSRAIASFDTIASKFEVEDFSPTWHQRLITELAGIFNPKLKDSTAKLEVGEKITELCSRIKKPRPDGSQSALHKLIEEIV
jgi:hypothetical protein